MNQREPFVRRGEPGDIPSILALYTELDDVHRQQHPELYPPDGVRRDRVGVERSLGDPHVGLFVAGLGSAASSPVSGFVRIVDVQTPDGGILAPRRFGLVDDLVVTAAAPRHGLAKALLGASEDWARERGLKALEVTVWAFNLAAEDLYRKDGFDVLRHYLRKSLVR